MLYHKVIALLVAVLSSVSLVSAEKVDASDTRITWVGRTSFDYGGSVRFDWTGVYCRIRFKGDTLRMTVSDTGRDYYNVYIDRPMDAEPSQVIAIQGDTALQFVMRPCRKIHNVVLQKRTEAEQGTTTFRSMETDGHFLQAEPYRTRQIEFIGDSYTCGYGVEGRDSTERFRPETENVCKSYASLLAHKLNADYFVLAHSGMGVCRNYNSKFPGWTMPKRYDYRFDMDSTGNVWYGNSEWDPLVIIMLGGNDFSCGVTPDYETFRAAYMALLSNFDMETTTVICCSKTKDTELAYYVERVVLESDLWNIYFFACDFDEYTNHRQLLGSDKHPNEKAHRRLAEQLYSFVKTFYAK